MLKKTFAAGGLAIGAMTGALLLTSPAQAGIQEGETDINAQKQEQAVSVNNAIVNTNTNTATAVSSNAVGLLGVTI